MSTFVPTTGSAAVVLIVVAGYLIGSLPVANTVARRHGIADLRRIGDRNPGYWNARTAIGAGAARPILLGDTVLGALGAAVGDIVATAVDGPWWWTPLGGGAAMLGHAAPLFERFRGGRSVLAFVGSAIVCAPLAAALSLAATTTVRLASGRTDRAARVGVASFPVIQFLIDGPERTLATGILMTFVGFRFATARLDARRRRPT